MNLCLSLPLFCSHFAVCVKISSLIWDHFVDNKNGNLSAVKVASLPHHEPCHEFNQVSNTTVIQMFIVLFKVEVRQWKHNLCQTCGKH